MRIFLASICFLFLVSSFLNTFVSPTKHLCNHAERDALLEFKTEFEVQKPVLDVDSEFYCYQKTESWVNKSKSNCCSWDGVTCDAKSGQVIGLDLSDSCLHGRLESNSSLFRLQHLRDLNLAYNNFTGSPIPAEFDKLEGLETLDLSKSFFSGQIPTKLLQLTKLVSLDLSSYSPNRSPPFFICYQNHLSVDETFLPRLAQNLRNLRDLDMSYSNLSSKIPHEFSTMWTLRSLRFDGCSLFGEFPTNVFLIPNLQSLVLNDNPNLRGNLPVFPGDNSLQILSLSNTSFSGIIPDSINNLKHLISFDLSFSNFSGKIPFSLGNLTHLSSLKLCSNDFGGEIPFSLGNLSHLSSLDLSYNDFGGEIPSSIFKISSLTRLFLDNNQFSDLAKIENVSLLTNLQFLWLGENKLFAVLDLNVFSPLKQLQQLDLSGIPLSTGNITYDSDFPSHLEYLYLSGCNITEFPKFLRNQRDLRALHLSNNKIKGQVPDWLWSLPELSQVDLSINSLSGFVGSSKALPRSKISWLDLTSNVFQGPLPVPPGHIQLYLAAKNNFSGEIPRSMCGLTSPFFIDLSSNNLHGPFPRCLETQMTSLSQLNLRNNSLSGSLPDIFMRAKELKSLDVGYNRFEGNLPPSLTGCSSLEVLNVEGNRISGMFPFQLNSLQNLQVLILRSNKLYGMLHHSDGVWFGFPQLKILDVSHNDFDGTLPSDYFLNWTAISSKNDSNEKLEYLYSGNGYYGSLVLMSKGISLVMERILTSYTAIDFSGNQLHGQIPDSIGLLKGLRLLNLSSNAFTGHIPSSLANLTNLESLDLSQNKISGEIPPELGTLSSLQWINVSHNQLVGSIPQGTQFQRQNCSSYEGNPGLNGPSLKNVCGDNHSPPPKPEPLEIEEEEDEEWINWMGAVIGFAPGIVFGLTIGYIMALHKRVWFVKTFG